jgi:hypothetical protein
MAAAGAQAAGLNRVVIGFWSSEKNGFQECLTVADNGNVTVHGDLIVAGAVKGGRGVPHADVVSRGFGPDAKRFLQAGFLSGVGGANVLVESARLTQPAGVRAATPTRDE